MLNGMYILFILDTNIGCFVYIIDVHRKNIYIYIPQYVSHILKNMYIYIMYTIVYHVV